MPATDLRRWLGEHPDRLESLIRQEVDRTDDERRLEAALTAHLRLLLEGLRATGRPDLRPGLWRLMEQLDRQPLADLETSARERLKADEAIAFEARLLFGAAPDDDPSLAGLPARMHVWLTENQRTLGVLTRQALERQVEQHDGDRVAAAEQLSTVALVQAHAVVLAMGLEATGEVLQPDDRRRVGGG